MKALREWFPLVVRGPARDGRRQHLFLQPRIRPLQSEPHRRTSARASSCSARTTPGGSTSTASTTSRAKSYDAFYPGYGASWPYYYGGIAMTYEQASVRGLVVRRSDDTLLTFRDTVRHHFVASVSTLETAAANREKLLDDFYRYARHRHRGGPQRAGQGVHPAAQPRRLGHRQTGGHPGGARHRGEARHGAVPRRRARVPRGNLRGADGAARQAPDPDAARSRNPHGRQVRGRRRSAPQAERQRSEIYDVTAWSLPLLFNVEAVADATRFRRAVSSREAGAVLPGECTAAAPRWPTWCRGASDAAGRLLTAALRQDLKVHSSDKPFTQNGIKFPAGTLIFKVAGNPADLGRPPGAPGPRDRRGRLRHQLRLGR